MAKYVYPAIFTLDKEGGCSVDFPDLDECYTCGEDLYDGLKMAEDALALMLYDMEQEKKEIPSATRIQDVKHEANDFVTYVSADTAFYERYYGNKLVKKNCTIPSWLEYEASKKNYNFSQVLKEALEEKLREK